MKKLLGVGLIVALAILASVMALTQSDQLLAQARAVAAAGPIPNMVGDWSVEGGEVGFSDPSIPAEGPNWSSISSSGQAVLHITEQRGHVFAGYVSAVPAQHDKVTGAVIEDGTITIQAVGVYNQNIPDRTLWWGKVSPLKDPTTFTITGHDFEEYGSTSTPSFSSSYINAKKVR